MYQINKWRSSIRKTYLYSKTIARIIYQGIKEKVNDNNGETKLDSIYLIAGCIFLSGLGNLLYKYYRICQSNTINPLYSLFSLYFSDLFLMTIENIGVGVVLGVVFKPICDFTVKLALHLDNIYKNLRKEISEQYNQFELEERIHIANNIRKDSTLYFNVVPESLYSLTFCPYYLNKNSKNAVNSDINNLSRY